MATFNKYGQFVEDLAEKVHNLSVDTLRIALASGVQTTGMTLLSQIFEISGGNGYATGGWTGLLVSSAQTTGLYKLVLANPPVWTGMPGTMSGFRYAVLYNDTPTSPLNPLIGYWDYGSTVTLNSGETFTVTFDQNEGVLTIT